MDCCRWFSSLFKVKQINSSLHFFSIDLFLLWMDSQKKYSTCCFLKPLSSRQPNRVLNSSMHFFYLHRNIELKRENSRNNNPIVAPISYGRQAICLSNLFVGAFCETWRFEKLVSRSEKYFPIVFVLWLFCVARNFSANRRFPAMLKVPVGQTVLDTITPIIYITLNEFV